MRERELKLETTDGPMACFEVTPEGSPRGAVIVVQEAFGVNDHIRDVTRRFAAAGHHAIAPAFFHRAGGGTADYGDFAAVIPLFEGVSDEGILADVDAGLEHLHEAGFPDAAIGVVGFCFGGRVTFLVAARRAIGRGRRLLRRRDREQGSAPVRRPHRGVVDAPDTMARAVR